MCIRDRATPSLLGKPDLDEALTPLALDKEEHSSTSSLARLGNRFCKIGGILDTALAKAFYDVANLQPFGSGGATFGHLCDDNAAHVGFKAKLSRQFGGEVLDREAKLVEALPDTPGLVIDDPDKFGLLKLAKRNLDFHALPVADHFDRYLSLIHI